MFSIHCALKDLAKLETGGYYADCALAEKAPQVINFNYDEGDGGDDDDRRGGGKDSGVDADSARLLLSKNQGRCMTMELFAAQAKPFHICPDSFLIVSQLSGGDCL